MDRKKRIGYWIAGSILFIIVLQFWLLAEAGLWV